MQFSLLYRYWWNSPFRILLIFYFITLSYSAPNKPLDCTDEEFTCACGIPKCIAKKYAQDGIPHCQDASDETTNDALACPDGTPSRRSPFKDSEHRFPSCNMPNSCLKEFGQVCLVINDSWHCMCKLGTVRPPGSIRCISTKLWPKITSKNASSNCTELMDDVDRLYKSSFYANETKSNGIKALLTKQYHDSGISHPSIDPNPKAVTVFRDDPRTNTDDIEVRVVEKRKKPYDENEEEQNEDANVFQFLKDVHSCNPNDTISCPGKNEVCRKTNEGFYQCDCDVDYIRNDGKCLALLDECADSKLNDCDPNAICMDNDLSYECLCKEGYIDMSETPSVRPGMECRRLVNECRSPLQNDCDPNSYCIDKPIGFTCRCKDEFTDISDLGAKRPGRKCRKLMNECANGMADCDPKAICSDTVESYFCRCPPGFVDVSKDPIGHPGRICAQLILDCNEATCSSNFSKCTETVSGTVCRCLPGYVDLDPSNPGSKCKNAKVPKTSAEFLDAIFLDPQ